MTTPKPATLALLFTLRSYIFTTIKKEFLKITPACLSVCVSYYGLKTRNWATDMVRDG